ncbi:hypothetical protein LIN78_02080 [Leeia sp. TBRC 13508]|uniref:Uncharacterized protein n=1 Tax=Leeia speluncae TaxID=2884804 RepID=A0ABS8D3V7_9NEIS|nr:hypothetical protein [Leeia speluncae]MCB6182343.1 hypothetical protein [Leeia speluncae]
MKQLPVIDRVAATERVGWKLVELGYEVVGVSVIGSESRIVLGPNKSFEKLKAKYGCETRERTNDSCLMVTTIKEVNVLWSEPACNAS